LHLDYSSKLFPFLFLARMFVALLVGALACGLLLALLLLSRLVGGVVRYAAWSRFKNRHLNIPHAGTFAMLQQVKPGGVAKMLEAIRSCTPVGAPKIRLHLWFSGVRRATDGRLSWRAVPTP
jgi:hypothetical protein